MVTFGKGRKAVKGIIADLCADAITLFLLGGFICLAFGGIGTCA